MPQTKNTEGITVSHAEVLVRSKMQRGALAAYAREIGVPYHAVMESVKKGKDHVWRGRENYAAARVASAKGRGAVAIGGNGAKEMKALRRRVAVANARLTNGAGAIDTAPAAPPNAAALQLLATAITLIETALAQLGGGR